MKRKILQLFLLVPILLLGSLSTNAQIKPDYIGNWKFEAPTAPEGFTYGIIALKKDSVIMEFTDGANKFPSNWVKVKSDSIIYESDINGTIVLFSLKINDKLKITGNAVWSEGVTLMNLTKKED
jgi:hypothetical protein